MLAAAARITRVVHIPINIQLGTLGAERRPDNFAAVQRRWWRFHIARSAALVLGLVALLGGTLTRTH